MPHVLPDQYVPVLALFPSDFRVLVSGIDDWTARSVGSRAAGARYRLRPRTPKLLVLASMMVVVLRPRPPGRRAGGGGRSDDRLSQTRHPQGRASPVEMHLEDSRRPVEAWMSFLVLSCPVFLAERVLSLLFQESQNLRLRTLYSTRGRLCFAENSR